MNTTRGATDRCGSAHPDKDCWFCSDAERGGPPPGGWLLDDGIWRAGAAPVGMATAGTVILESRRHVLDQSDFDTRESVTFVPVLGRLLTAMRSGLGCDRAYQWSTMAAYEHFHMWLIPWWRTSVHDGPAHLVDVVGAPAAESDVLAAAAQVEAALQGAS